MSITNKEFPTSWADLIFTKVSKGKQVDFLKFVKIIGEIALLSQKENEGSLEIFALNLVVPRQRLDTIDLKIGMFRSFLSSEESKKLLAKNKRILNDYFLAYSNYICNNPIKIEIAELVMISTDIKLIPTLLSSLEAAKISRQIMNSECFDDTLVYSEFEQSLSIIGLFGYEREGVTNLEEALEKLLQVLNAYSNLIKDHKLDVSRLKL